MSAPATVERDDIAIMMGELPPEEHELRTKLRGQRNAMSRMIATTKSDTARCLAWMVCEYVTAEIYSPASLERLRELRRFCHRLCLTALQAEEIDA